MASNAAVEGEFSVASLVGASQIQVTSRQFHGGRVKALVGSCEIDLRGATLADNGAKLNILIGLGGVTIRVPDDWAVNVRRVTILGSVTSKRAQPASPTGEIIITGVTLVGGVVIRS
jgi:predicted membrane protein